MLTNSVWHCVPTPKMSHNFLCHIYPLEILIPLHCDNLLLYLRYFFGLKGKPCWQKIIGWKNYGNVGPKYSNFANLTKYWTKRSVLILSPVKSTLKICYFSKKMKYIYFSCNMRSFYSDEFFYLFASHIFLWPQYFKKQR